MKHQIFKSIPVLLVIMSGLIACKKDTTEPFENLPPQQQLPNPLPASALVSRIQWAETDHQTFIYNARGQVSLLRSQWQYVEGDPSKINTIVYEFLYDAQDRPVQMNVSDGLTVKYYYDGNRIAKTQELYPDDAVAKEVTYIYAKGRVVQEIWRVSDLTEDTVSTYKHDFSYDGVGNLNKIKSYEQGADQQFKLLETIEYSDFDDKINPVSWMLRYPYLPQMQFQFNNPQKEVRRPAQGTEETTIHAYRYNDQDLPVSKSTTLPSGFLLTAKYRY